MDVVTDSPVYDDSFDIVFDDGTGTIQKTTTKTTETKRIVTKAPISMDDYFNSGEEIVIEKDPKKKKKK